MPGKNVPFPPMEAQLVNELPLGDNLQYEPKWDGFSHGETHGSPVSPLLCTQSRSNVVLGSRRAKPGSARAAAATQRTEKD
jgi:hypothetical protein